MKEGRKLKNALLVLVLIAAGFGLVMTRNSSHHSAARAETKPTNRPDIVATVDEQKITAKVYEMYLQNGIEALGLSDKTKEGREKIELLKEGIISEMIDRILVEAEARRLSLSIPDEKFEAEYNKRVLQMGDQELYRAYLTERSLSDQEFRDTVRQELYGALVMQQLTKDLKVAEGEARAFYEKEKANPAHATLFIEPERVRASHILINARRSQMAAELASKGNQDRAQLDRSLQQEQARRRARASQVLREAKGGADFATLAKQYSDDPGTAVRGGDLGLFARNTHTARFDDAAFALKTGQTSDLVETEYGFHIIKVTDHRPERTRNFEEVRATIEQQLLARKRAEHLKSWLEQRRREARINVEPFYQVGQFKSVNANVN